MSDLIRREDARLIALEYISDSMERHGALEAIRALPAVQPDTAAIREACSGLRSIVEGIDGAMRHGTWRDKDGTRLKDTPEWVAVYNALTMIDKEKADD